MILFAAEDVGPAKYLVSLSKVFKNEIFFKGSKNNNFLLKENHFRLINDYSKYKFEIIVTGTSLGDCIDKELIIWGKEKKIPTISIIEHWSWYLKRFFLNNEYIFPDYIIINDNIALKEAIEDGIDKKILNPLGNPYLEELSNKLINCLERKEYLNHYKIPFNKRIVIFISESLKNDFGSELGYDEFQVISILKTSLKENDFLIIKTHPEEDKSKYKKFVDKSTTIIAEKMSLESLILIGDKIIGMASMLLIELSLFRRDIISFRPNSKRNFFGKTIGATNDAANIEELKYFLHNPIKNDFNLKNYFNSSSIKIKEFILSKI